MSKELITSIIFYSLLALPLVGLVAYFLIKAYSLRGTFSILSWLPVALLLLAYMAGWLWGDNSRLMLLFFLAAAISLILSLLGVALTFHALLKGEAILTLIIATCLAGMPFVLLCFSFPQGYKSYDERSPTSGISCALLPLMMRDFFITRRLHPLVRINQSEQDR